ncbi:MAG TPA: MraY family glycosyltransferase [Planctomycetota bacterium]|nr:MraY family glycosyltransferase [Planctomycetota bacterium]
MANPVLVAGLAFAVPFVLSALLTALAMRVSPRVGLVDAPGGRKAHERPMPLGGGVAMFLAWGVPLAAVLVLAGAGGPFGEFAARARPLGLILAGGFVIMLLGLLDDAFDLSPAVRLAVQVAVASGLYLASHELRVTLFAGWSVFSFLYTVLWIVGITNAFNFLDNTDGLSAGVALVASVVLAIVGFQSHQELMAWLALAFAGATGGFLLFNFPPARIYMGDAGGLFLGFVLSVLTILFTFYESGDAPSGRLYSVLMPLFILALPVFDTLTVVAIRLREGRPVWRGDRSHFSHRLLAIGMSKRETVVFIYLVTFCLGLASTLLGSLDEAGAVVILLVGVIIFVLIALLERAGRRRN